MKLAYDVGVYDGADTTHYLSLGYRVVGIEASPDLCKVLRQKFASEMAVGRFKLLNIAVGDTEGTLPFFLSENPQWNSFDRAAATRNGFSATEISVPTRRIRDVIQEHGHPHFIKVDIEGADYACLRGMGDIWPNFLSFEATQNGFDEVLLNLASRGYKRFSLVQQRLMRPVVIPPAGSLSHVHWSARQWLRWQLRRHPWIHKAIAGARSSMRWAGGRRAHRANPSNVQVIHHGLTPMEHGAWHSLPEFLWMWRNVVTSGMIDSSWFDVHASR